MDPQNPNTGGGQNPMPGGMPQNPMNPPASNQGGQNPLNEVPPATPQPVVPQTPPVSPQGEPQPITPPAGNPVTPQPQPAGEGGGSPVGGDSGQEASSEQSEGASTPTKDGDVHDIVIIGSGPAGLTAAIYATRAALSTAIVGGTKWGGQLMLTTEVENFPGFPEGILGPDLMMQMRQQAEKFGAKFIEQDVESVDFKKKPFTIAANGQFYKGKSVIIATGADTLWLGLPSEQRLIGRGLSSCAPCDAPFFKNKNVIVVGGGDSAMEEALVLTKFAASVTIVHRRDLFRASDIMQKRVLENPKIRVMWNSEVVEVLGENKVTGVKIKNIKTNGTAEVPIDGIFVAIGHTPSTQIFKDQIGLDERGYVKVYDHSRTNMEGVFAAGDVHDYHYRQAVTAAAYGCMAAMDAEKWIDGHKTSFSS